jgi:hypothetical protein
MSMWLSPNISTPKEGSKVVYVIKTGGMWEYKYAYYIDNQWRSSNLYTIMPEPTYWSPVLRKEN